jgi:hypothetical protein
MAVHHPEKHGGFHAYAHCPCCHPEATPAEKASFFALHDLDTDAELQRVGHVVLIDARNLLRQPCRRDELPTVASLCNTGSSVCLRVYRKVIERSGEGTSIDQDARARYRSAVAAYAETAAALNEAVGAVLFEGLDAPDDVLELGDWKSDGE